MRTSIKQLFVLCLFSLALFSCEKDEDKLILKTAGTPVLQASSSNVELALVNASQDAVTLSWPGINLNFSNPEMGYNAVSYTLQMDLKGNNFAKPQALTVDTTSYTFKVDELNTLVNKLDSVQAFKPNEVEVRVIAHLSENVEDQVSDVLTLNVSPYLSEPVYKTIYMVGAATDADWNNANAIAMLRDPNDAFVYTYTGKFKADYFKFLGKRGSWAPMWGDAGNGMLAFRETEADPDPASIQIPSEGNYTVKVNLRENTFSVTPYDANGKDTYPSIGIIGSFNGWTDIVPMTKSDFNPHYWTLDYTFAEDVELKFRIAKDWSVNWGAPLGGESKLYNTAGGENLKIEAGTYMIVFNDLTGNYLFVKK